MEDTFLTLLLVQGVLFLVVVCPMWLALHYKKIYRSQRMLTEEEHMELERLTELAESMGERITTLESILDASTEQWRRTEKSDQEGGHHDSA